MTWRGTNQKEKAVADVAVFMIWDEVVRGREKRALRVYKDTTEYFEGLEKQNAIENFEVGIVGPAGPARIGGFMVVRGTEDQLRAVRESKEFRRLALRTRLVVDHLRVVRVLLGGQIADFLREYQEEIKDLD
jgi:hypothetical protein